MMHSLSFHNAGLETQQQQDSSQVTLQEGQKRY